MKKTFINLLGATICVAAFSGAQTVYACAAGYTCFTDAKTGGSSRVQYSNDDWGSFGWDNKADSFYNAGRNMENCLYTGYNQNYGQSGQRKFLLKRRHALYTSGPSVPVKEVTVDPSWSNVVSSNKWTYATKLSNCPKQ